MTTSLKNLPTPAESLACPEGLSAKGKRAHKAVMAFLKRFECGGEFPINPGGCQTFYAPQAWAKHEGRERSKGEVLAIVYDGGDVFQHLSYSADFDTSDKFAEHMEKAGFRFEPTNCWSGIVYAD